MSHNDDTFDSWSSNALTVIPAADEPKLIIETIKGVEPLDDQFGVHPPKTVPDVLYESLFGQPEPSEVEIAHYGSVEAVPPMQTYAILDAGKTFALVETLEASGLAHRCLFKGSAYDELKDVAPWIVRLEEGNKFTRNLFTVGKAPWYLWDKAPGIFVRSRVTFEDMWRHFRKFTKVQDEEGNWLYFRFWEPRIAAQYFAALKDRPEMAERWFLTHDLIEINAIMVLEASPIEDSQKSSAVFHHIRSLPMTLNPSRGAFTLSDADMNMFRHMLMERDIAVIVERTKKHFPEFSDGKSHSEFDHLSRRILSRMMDFGFTQKPALLMLLVWELQFGPQFERCDPEGNLSALLTADEDESERFEEIKERMTALGKD